MVPDKAMITDPHRHWARVGPVALLLYPLSLLFRLLVSLRRGLYRLRLLRSRAAACPVIVVGNITVGGSGKTPLVIWLSRWLQGQGFSPGIVSRGYGGKAHTWPQQVRPDGDPAMAGDEAVLLAQRTRRPVCVGPDRPAAIDSLLRYTDCDIVISDDGLQHYAMRRDIEIAVIDGERRFGNGLMLPAGPLREPLARLRSVNFVVCNGEPARGEHRMQLRIPQLVSLLPPFHTRDIESFRGRRVRAVAGIGNPARFFDMLWKHGMLVVEQPFPDHHAFSAKDFAFDEALPIVMTEKDAVKCRHLVDGEAWVVRVEAQLDDAFIHRLGQMIETLRSC